MLDTNIFDAINNYTYVALQNLVKINYLKNYRLGT